MTDSYPPPPPFSEDEVLPLRSRSDLPAKRGSAPLAAGLAAVAVVLGLGAGAFFLSRGGSTPDGTVAARIEAGSAGQAAPAAPGKVAPAGVPVAAPSATLPTAPAPPPVAAAPAQPSPPPATRPPPAARAEPTRRLASDEIRTHLERGEALLAQGDLAAARLFFERVSEAGDARGASGLARSYDPAVLSRLPVHAIAGDEAEAERWRRAAASMAPAFAERR